MDSGFVSVFFYGRHICNVNIKLNISYILFVNFKENHINFFVIMPRLMLLLWPFILAKADTSVFVKYITKSFVSGVRYANINEYIGLADMFN